MHIYSKTESTHI